MTFDGFHDAPLIEVAGFSPGMIGIPAPEAATLDAALREAARAERAEATLLDLWLHRPGGANLRALESPATSGRAWAAMADGGGILELPAGKGMPLFAAYGDDEIVVKGSKEKQVDDDSDEDTGGNYGDGSYPGGQGSGGPDGTGSGENLPSPNCSNSNAITHKDTPDGAKYLVPEDVTAAKLEAALTYIHDLASTGGRAAVLQAIYNMYENPAFPFFVDFKDWGTANGPPGSQGAGMVTYFSTSLGQNVTANAFEAFGNYFFGVVCTLGGLTAAETRAIAALTQSGRLHEIANGDMTAVIEAMVLGDDPQDRPFVTDGINDGSEYEEDPSHQFGVQEGSCGGGS